MKKIPHLYFILFYLCSLIIHSQNTNEAPQITVTGNQHFCPNNSNSKNVVKTVSITDNDSTTLDEVSIQISSGYNTGNDLLSLNGTHLNINSTWNNTTGQLTLTGKATLAEYENAILNVVYSSSVNTKSIKQFSIVLGDAFYLPSTGHYYIYVENDGIRWDNARIAASNSTYYGLEGYLTTLTTLEEATFAGEQVTGTGWIGATDNDGAEGEWNWVTGPEAGTQFWNGDENGNAVNGEFEFWNNGEPNDYPNDNIPGQENFAHITAPTIGVANSWNDLAIQGGDGVFAAKGYIVEFGGMPNDPTLDLSGVTTIRISCSVITNRKVTYRAK